MKATGLGCNLNSLLSVGRASHLSFDFGGDFFSSFVFGQRAEIRATWPSECLLTKERSEKWCDISTQVTLVAVPCVL